MVGCLHGFITEHERVKIIRELDVVRQQLIFFVDSSFGLKSTCDCFLSLPLVRHQEIKMISQQFLLAAPQRVLDVPLLL